MIHSVAMLLVVVFSTWTSEAPTSEKPTTPREAIVAATKARNAHDLATAQRILEDAVEKWPHDTILESYLAAALFAGRQIDPSYRHFKHVCEEAGFEGDCSIAVGIDLVRNRWDDGLQTAEKFTETACQRSDRLWALKQLARDPRHAMNTAERLVAVEPGSETSYLILAAAQWRAGHRERARQTLRVGRQRATKLVLLDEPITWTSP